MDGRGLPLSVLCTPGQAGDNPQLLPLLDGIRVPRVGPGRPRQRPDHLIADKAYSHPSTRRALRRRGIAHSIPEKRDQRAHRLKQFRALSTRYAKRAAYYRALLVLAAVVLWLREDPQDTP